MKKKFVYVQKEAAAAAAAAATTAVHPRTSSSCCLSLMKEASYTHTYSPAEVPVWHTPVEVAEVRFSMTCSVVDGQGKRGNVHTPAMMSAAFPDVVVFDGLI